MKRIYAPDGNSYGFSQQSGFRRKRKDLKRRFDGLWVEKENMEPDPRLDDLKQQPFDDPTPHRDPLPRPHGLSHGVPIFANHDRDHFSLTLTLARIRASVPVPEATYYVGMTQTEDLQNSDIANLASAVFDATGRFTIQIPQYTQNSYMWLLQHPNGRQIHNVDFGYPFSVLGAFQPRGQHSINNVRYDARRTDLLLPVFSGATMNLQT